MQLGDRQQQLRPHDTLRRARELPQQVCTRLVDMRASTHERRNRAAAPSQRHGTPRRNGAFVSAHVEGMHDDAALVVDVKDLSNAKRSGLQVAVRAAAVPIDKALYQAILPAFRPV